MMLLMAFAAATAAIPEGPALTEAIRARDAEFFTVYFDRCDPVKVRSMITDDFEMYHDKGGVVARDAQPFIDDYTRSCTEKQKPDAWRSRRALVDASLRVDPVPGFGAIEDGVHEFYERKGNGPEKKAGTARFTQLWQLTPEGWKLARVFSFAHAAAK
jgi:hypothetical protein